MSLWYDLLIIKELFIIEDLICFFMWLYFFWVYIKYIMFVNFLCIIEMLMKEFIV